MEHYAQSSIVAPLTTIRRHRLLPRNGELVVRVGQDVTPLQVLARAPISVQFRIVPVSNLLGISPEQVDECLLVSPGDKVDLGMPLAQKKRFLGQKQVESPLDGVVASIHRGRVVIKQTSDWFELRSMVQGRVVRYVEDRGVMMEIVGAHIQALWATGNVALGPLLVLGEGGKTILRPNHITTQASNQIVAVGQINSMETVLTAVDAGVKGFIAGSMPAEIAIRCQSLDISIILTDGFGDQGMAEPIFEQLKKLDGEETTLFTQTEAGLAPQRPEIIIPRQGVPIANTGVAFRPLQLGQKVRVMRHPYLSQVGTIVKLYQRLHTAPSGVRAPGADVRLVNGQIVFVPTANMDLLI